MLQLLLTVLLFIQDGNFKTLTRIYNGHPDSQNLYPYVLLIEEFVSNDYKRYCSGTLIKKNGYSPQVTVSTKDVTSMSLLEGGQQTKKTARKE